MEGVLDLVGGDVLAAADDEVFLAVYDIYVSVFVEHTHVARVKPASPQGFLRFLGPFPVALHHVGTTGDDLTHFAGSDVVVVLVDDPDVAAEEFLAHGAETFQALALQGIILLGEVGEQGRCLGEAVHHEYDVGAEHLHCPLEDGYGGCLSADGIALQCAERVAAFLVGVENVDEARVDEGDVGDLLLSTSFQNS